MTYTIRQLGLDDVPAYRALRLEALRNHPEAFASDYDSAAAKPDSFFTAMIANLAFFGAFVDGRLVGIVAFDQSAGAREAHRGWLYQMYVQPQMRGTGCAMALIEHLLDYSKPLVLQVHLGVAADNGAALALYQRAGFAIYGTEPRYMYVNGRYIDEHLMVRFLDKAPGDQK